MGMFWCVNWGLGLGLALGLNPKVKNNTLLYYEGKQYSDNDSKNILRCPLDDGFSGPVNYDGIRKTVRFFFAKCLKSEV